MDGILEFFQTPLGMLVIGIGLIIFKDSPIIVKILEFLKIRNPAPQPQNQELTVLSAETEKPERDDAFVAANVLVEYFENKPECKEGLEAAKKAGQCLFH